MASKSNEIWTDLKMDEDSLFRSFVTWVQCHKPPMTRNGKHTTYKNGDDWGMVYDCFIHIISFKRGFPWDSHDSPGELWLSQAVEANKATRRCDIAPRLKETSTVMLPKNHRTSQVKNEVLQRQGDILTCFLVLIFLAAKCGYDKKIQHVAPINVD